MQPKRQEYQTQMEKLPTRNGYSSEKNAPEIEKLVDMHATRGFFNMIKSMVPV